MIVVYGTCLHTCTINAALYENQAVVVVAINTHCIVVCACLKNVSIPTTVVMMMNIIIWLYNVNSRPRCL